MRGVMRTALARLRSVRLLPAMMVALAALGTVKLLSLGLGRDAGPSFAPAAMASAPKPPAPTPAAPPAAAPAVPPPAPPPADPGPSEAERAVLQDLRARRVALEDRDKALAAREALLNAAEKRLSERVDQLAALQTRLEALERSRRERDEANWRGLVKTYETMRPRDAAAIFNDLDQPVLMQVLDRMKEAKAAPILAAMQPERARLATAQLAQWRTRETGARE
jgi:flagellar motility protein MotE (MotC chaperone)